MAIVAVVLNNKLYIANVGELVFVSGSVSAFLRMAGVLGSKRHLNVGTVSLVCGQAAICLLLTQALEISLALHLCRCRLMWCV